MTWSVDTDTPLVLYAKLLLIKNKNVTQELHHKREEIM